MANDAIPTERFGVVPCILSQLLSSFVSLGTFGFGEPMALAGSMAAGCGGETSLDGQAAGLAGLLLFKGVR